MCLYLVSMASQLSRQSNFSSAHQRWRSANVVIWHTLQCSAQLFFSIMYLKTCLDGNTWLKIYPEVKQLVMNELPFTKWLCNLSSRSRVVGRSSRRSLSHFPLFLSSADCRSRQSSFQSNNFFANRAMTWRLNIQMSEGISHSNLSLERLGRGVI